MRDLLTKLWIELQPTLKRFVNRFQNGEDILQDAFEFLWTKVTDEWKPQSGQDPKEALDRMIRAAVWYSVMHEYNRLEQDAKYLTHRDHDDNYSNKPHDDPWALLDQIDETTDNEERKQGRLGLVRQALLHASEPVQRVFQLAYFEGKTWKETAEIMHLPLHRIQAVMRTGVLHVQRWIRDNTAALPCIDSTLDVKSRIVPLQSRRASNARVPGIRRTT